jgi:hypothetical protein
MAKKEVLMATQRSYVLERLRTISRDKEQDIDSAFPDEPSPEEIWAKVVSGKAKPFRKYNTVYNRLDIKNLYDYKHCFKSVYDKIRECRRRKGTVIKYRDRLKDKVMLGSSEKECLKMLEDFEKKKF